MSANFEFWIFSEQEETEGLRAVRCFLMAGSGNAEEWLFHPPLPLCAPVEIFFEQEETKETEGLRAVSCFLAIIPS